MILINLIIFMLICGICHSVNGDNQNSTNSNRKINEYLKNSLKSQNKIFHENYKKELQIESEGMLNKNYEYNKSESNLKFNILNTSSKNQLPKSTLKNIFISTDQKKIPKKLPSFLRDKNKIQSNNKNIEDYSNKYFVYKKNIIILPTLPKKYTKKHEKQKFQQENSFFIEENNKNDKSLNISKRKTISLETSKTVKRSTKNNKSILHKDKELQQQPIEGRKLKNKSKRFYHHNNHRSKRAVTAKKERIWDFGVIPYEIDKIFSGSHKALFKQAMRHWENFTCIKFVERDPKVHSNYIYFTVRNCGCCSFVGKRGNGRQAISIGRNCEKFGIVVHELGHVIGFWHEHTRIDRDQHVTINRANILKGQEYNFNVLSPEDVDSLGMPYDYKSIMHYARNTFSKSVYLDTIAPNVPNDQQRPEIGQRLHLSHGDIGQANLLYQCPICGNTFQQNHGKIISQYFYVNDNNSKIMENIENCEWRITATMGERIILKIHEVKLFNGNISSNINENCEDNYLEIRDGYWFKSPLIKKICGGNLINNVDNNELEIITDSSRMLLKYVNRNLMKGFHGFSAEFDVICGGEIFINEARRIDSPNYPLEYLSDKECIWKISVEENFQVALKFQSFEIENHDNCIYDYVEIRDGDSSDSKLIGVFCGYKLPPNIKSNSNKMYIKFVSDSSVQKVGFSAIVLKEYDECETGNHSCHHECINTLGSYECNCNAGYDLQTDGITCEVACGGIINATVNNGITTLNSPSFPDVYPILKDCIWEIIAPENSNVFLNFTYFDLEGTKYLYTECNYDYITIYSKLKDNRLKKIGIYCGSEIPPFINSEQNILRIEFHSDKSVQHTGFFTEILTDIDECATDNGGCQHYCKNTFGSYNCSCRIGYTINENRHNCTETKCKFEISSPYGIIHSPNYPNNYPRNTYCFWHFTTVPGHRIQLTFHDFEVESHQECIYDHVAIYDGKSENSSTLGVYCGGKEPYTVFASTNELYMVLKTDIGLQKKGFMATHSTECGGYLRATNQTKIFYSHARYGHRSYKRNMYCVWRIQADQDSSVKLNFNSFSIEYSDKCDYDYVEISEEYSHSKKSRHGKYCGNSKPPMIISYTDTLLVKFESDSSTSLKGFSISYIAVEPPPDNDEQSNDYDDSVTPFPGYHKSVYYDDDENS